MPGEAGNHIKKCHQELCIKVLTYAMNVYKKGFKRVILVLALADSIRRAALHYQVEKLFFCYFNSESL